MSMYVFVHPECNFPAPEGLKIIVPFLIPSRTQRVKSSFDCVDSIKLINGQAKPGQEKLPWAGKALGRKSCTEANLESGQRQRGGQYQSLLLFVKHNLVFLWLRKLFREIAFSLVFSLTQKCPLKNQHCRKILFSGLSI